MKAITLKHPWPWAILALGKNIENRTWRPYPGHLRPGDWLAIHGGKVPGSASDERALIRVLTRELTDRFGGPGGESIRPGVVAVCRFAGVVTESDSPWFDGPIGWRLRDVEALPEPVPCRGAQGLWDLPDDVFAKVREQMLIDEPKRGGS